MAYYLLPFRPARGRAIVAPRNKVPWCAAAGAMLRRRYAKNAYLKSLVPHKDQAISPRQRQARNRADLGRNAPLSTDLGASRAGAAEALLPTRNDFPVVDI